MRRVILRKRLMAGVLCLLFASNNVFALNAATDLIEHTSGVNPTTTGNVTNITTTHNIDTYHWSAFNLGGTETANYIFNANGQTALNYLSPGANPSAIYGSIVSSGAKGNILLFNPNGIMMGGGASVSGANTFFASTNKFDGIVNGKITFSEADTNNALTVGNIALNGVNNAHFVAPNVSITADSINTANSLSVRAIGGGEYDVNTNIFSNETGVKAPIAGRNIVDVNANITSNKITIKAKADADTYATAMVSGEIKANKAISGENGEIYIIASNDSLDVASGIQVVQNAKISGESAKVEISAQDYTQNANIDASGSSGGSVKITASKDFNQNADILATGMNTTGGNIEINAGDITAISTATTDVSGKTSGGTINETATNTLKNDATIKANCTGENGNGGTINLLSEGTADISGTVEAKKGSLSGNGGNVEISAKSDISLDANINTTDGFLTIDPRNIVITTNIFTPYGMLPSYVEALLLFNNVKLLADNDITVHSALGWSNKHSLTLDSGRNIAVNANITSTKGDLFLIANDVNNPCLNISHRGNGLGGITTASGVTINTGIGDTNFLTKETGSTYKAADTIIGSDIFANNFTAENDGAGKDINLTGNLTAQGLATLIATDISISNPAYAFGGFDIDALGSVTTNNLITTDATHTGADVAIEANEGSLNGTSITTGDIDAGNKFVSVNLDNTDNNTNGLITIGNITAGGSISDTGIYIGNDNSSLTSGISINSFNTTGMAFINGMLVHDVNIADTSSSGGELTIYSGANLTTHDLKSTATGNAIFLVGNINSDNTTNANLTTGKIEATSGDVGIVMEDNDNNIATITVDNVETNNLHILNLDTSVGSDVSVNTIKATGNAELTGSNISITNGSSAFGGFNIEAQKNVTTNALTTTDGTLINPGADIIINANQGLFADTFITVGDINAGAGDVTLTLPTVDNSGDVTLNGVIANNLTVDPANININSAIVTTGNQLYNATNNITVTNTGSVTSNGASSIITFDAGNNISVNGAGFINTTGASSNTTFTATAGDISISNASSITTAGTATYNAGRDINNAGLIKGSKATTLTADRDIIVSATTGNIQGTGAASDFGLDAGRSITINGNILTNGGDLTANANTSASHIGIAELVMGSNGKIDTSSIGFGTGNVSLTLDANTNSGDIILYDIKGNNIVVDNQGTSSGSDVILNGPLMATSTTGTSSINSETGVITFNNATTSTFGNNLNLTADGNITQSVLGNIIKVNNDTHANTTGTITLNGTNNDFSQNGSGQVYVASLANPATAATINDVNSIRLGDVYLKQLSAANVLNVTAKDDITQCAGKTIKTYDMNLNSTNGGTISQADATSTMLVKNDAHFNTTGTVNLPGTNNDFSQNGSGQVYVASLANPATAATINDANSIRLGDVYVSGHLGVTAGGAITQCDNKVIDAGSLALTANGDITQGSGATITSNGTSTLEAGSTHDIILNNDGNDFVGNVIISSTNDVDIADKNDLNLGASTLAGELTAAAAQDINVNGVITGPDGVGLNADRSININSNINSDNGNVVLIANNGTHSGTPADITMALGTTISAPLGDVEISLLGNPDAGDITLNEITALTIKALNQSLAAGTDIILDGVLTTTGTTANPLIVSSDGGNFINNEGSGALVTDPTQRWLVYTGSPADTTLGGLVPANTYYSSTISNPTPENVPAGNSVLYRTPNPNPSGGGGGGGGGAGAIVGGTVGGAAAAGAAGGFYGLGLAPGLILGLASPIRFDETMIDVICDSQKDYPLLVRNMQYVYQTDDICKLDPEKIGSSTFIPDSSITNGSYDIVKIKIPDQFANAPKGVTVRITQKSQPFGISKNTPDMNFNVFNTLSDKEINSMYQTRRFLKPKYLSQRLANTRNSRIETNNGIVQKTISVNPSQIKNNLSVAVNYLKDGRFPRKNSTMPLDKQAYSLVVQFVANK